VAGNTQGNSRVITSAVTPLTGATLNRPNSISGLSLWLDSYEFVNSNDGYDLPAWPDASGNNRPAIKLTATPPVVKDHILVGNSSVYFDGHNGTDGYIESSTSPISVNSTIFSVVQIEDRVNDGYAYIFNAGTGGASNEQAHLLKDGYFSFGAGNNLYFVQSDERMRDKVFNIYATTYDGTQCKLYINGVLVKTSAVAINDISTGSYAIGQPIIDSFGYFDGYVSEIIVHNRELSSPERVEVEEYLSAKHAITLGTFQTRFPLANVNYYRPITINNGSGETLTEHQVLVVDPIITDTNLTLSYQFDEPSGSTVKDSSGNLFYGRSTSKYSRFVMVE
jgi:hypothetical protein